MSRSLPDSPHALLRAWPASALALWASAWTAGETSPDQVLHTLHDYAQAHDIDADPRVPIVAGGTALDLVRLVGEAPAAAVVMPGPGDAQGLGPGLLDEEVLALGEVLLLTQPGGGAISVTGRGTYERCRWTIRAVDAAIDVDALGGDRGIGELEYELREAVGDAAAVIARVSGPRAVGPADLRDALAARTQARLLDLPPHDRQRVDRILATAAQLDAIIELAGGGLGASAAQVDSADAELRRLSSLTRRARAAAINALLREYRRPS